MRFKKPIAMQADMRQRHQPLFARYCLKSNKNISQQLYHAVRYFRVRSLRTF